MKERSGKKIWLLFAFTLLCAGCFLLFDSLKSYAHTVPILIGQYKQAAFAVLGMLLAFCLGFYFRPLNKRTAAGTLGIAFAVSWFTVLLLLKDRIPAQPWGDFFSHWMPLPLISFAAGTALWLGELFPKKNLFSLSENMQLISALLLLFIAVQPGLSGGFNWDDAFFSVEAQSMRISGESVFARVWKEIVDYLKIGRINPFATFHFLVFYFIPDVRVYKILLVVLTLLNGVLFYRFLRLWNREHFPAAAALLFVPLCFQFRIYHDPLNSYYGLMQVMFCELMGALLCFLHWLREGKKRHLLCSLFCFTLGLMSYEMFFPLTALFLIPAFRHEKNPVRAIRKILPYIFPALLIFALSMILRTNITEETAYNGTSFGLDIPVVLRTFAAQVGAAFPLRYRTAGNDAGLFGQGILWKTVFNTSLSVFLKSIRWQDLLCCAILCTILLTKPEYKTKFSVHRLIFGALLWLLPGLVISLSEKYQADLRPGLAYIPVYFSCFGMAMLLYEISALLSRFIQERTLRLLLSGISCAVFLINIQDSRHINDMLNNVFLYPRAVGEAALQAGITGETENPTVISKNPYYLWEHGWMKEPYQDEFYSLNSRSTVHALSAEDLTAQYSPSDTEIYINPENTVIMSYGGNEHRGFAKCGRLRGTGFNFENRTTANEMVSDVYLFVSGENQTGVSVLYLTRDGEWLQQPIENAWLIRQTDKGTLYKLQQKGSVRFDSIVLVSR
ncbi:MAG: hypothetical protein IJI14_12270 [Anaerolineaceae bacterium]|nr:hypothetical protein [Anaerolineaceae bacterium]